MHNFKYFVGGAALLLATSALAGGPEAPPPVIQGFYVNANGGVDFFATPEPYDTTGWNAGLGVGYRYNSVRLELAGTYLGVDASGRFRNLALPIAFGRGTVSFGQLELTDVLLNGYYDFNFNSNFIPYVGAGIGYLYTWSRAVIAGNLNPNNNANWSASSNNMAFQGIVGLDYQVSDHFRVGLSYHALGWTRSYKTVPGSNTGLLNGSVQNPTRWTNLINLGVSYFF